MIIVSQQRKIVCRLVAAGMMDLWRSLVNDSVLFSEDQHHVGCCVRSREEGLFPEPQSRLKIWGCSTFVGERLGGKVGTNVI